MKAIYINLDPYLAEIADWLNAGKPGTAPKFVPLPLAVTVPLGESACIFCLGNTDGEGALFIVGDQRIIAMNTGDLDPSGEGPFLATGVKPGFSIYPTDPEDSRDVQYSVFAVDGSSVSASFKITDEDDSFVVAFSIPVLVRREQAQGPVDLVDFTPPAASGSAFIADQCGFESALREASFSGVSLSGANTSDLNLSGADASGLLLAPANASGLSLENADASGLSLAAADASGLSLAAADACGLELDAARFSGMGLGMEMAQTPEGSSFHTIEVGNN